MSFTCHNHGWRHALNCCPICHPELKPAQSSLAELKAEDIVSPLSALDDISPDELLYYATPHYDEIQAQKALRAQQLKDNPNG